jgi:RHS repeat-associated protein
VITAGGTLHSQQLYKPWGETRYTSATSLPTRYQYTGQYPYTADFGLHFYNARWYDSSLGRFAQADSIVPGGVQGLDRYAYVNNNALRYNDPTGHFGKDNTILPEGGGTRPLLGGNGGSGSSGTNDSSVASNSCADKSGVVVFCFEVSPSQATELEKGMNEFADAIDFFGLVSGASGLGLSFLSLLTKEKILSPEFFALMTMGILSPEAVSKIGLVVVAGTLYLAAGSFEMGSVTSQLAQSDITKQGGVITVSMLDIYAPGPIEITFETHQGKYQATNWTVIPILYLFVWGQIKGLEFQR